MKPTLILTNLCLVALLACSSNVAVEKSDLPANPKRIVITWVDHGGMFPLSENIYISADSCFWIKRMDQLEQKVYFTASSDELTQLYASFIEQDFDQIKETHEEVYDRGGTSIGVTADDFSASKSNTGMTFIALKDQSKFSTIDRLIYNFAMDKIKDSSVTLEFTLSQAIQEFDADITIRVNRDLIFHTIKDSIVTPITNKQFPGEIELTVSLLSKDELNHYKSALELKTQLIRVEISKTNYQFIIDIKDDELVITQKIAN